MRRTRPLVATDTSKTHLEFRSGPLCKMVRSYQRPLRVSPNKADVTCGRCQLIMRTRGIG